MTAEVMDVQLGELVVHRMVVAEEGTHTSRNVRSNIRLSITTSAFVANEKKILIGFYPDIDFKEPPSYNCTQMVIKK